VAPNQEKTENPERRKVIALLEPMSSAAESYRNIRSSIFYTAPEGDMKVLTVTSSLPREGKTTTVVNLAVVIAQCGKKTLLIDGDFHRPKIHRLLG